jgi:general secretion pathway protein L
LGGDAVLHTVLTLPAAVEENLREVLGFELDRRTPFAAADAQFAFRIVERNRTKEQLRVALAVTPRTRVADALAVAQRLGAAVEALDLSEEPGSGILLTSATDAEDAAPRAGGRRATRAAALAGLALALAAAIVPVWRSHHEIALLKSEIASARADAAKASQLEDEVSRLSGDAAFLTARKQQSPAAIALLAEVTHQLPDDTWLEDLSFDAGELSMRGYSTSSSGLIKRLTTSRLMADPHFESPVTVESGSGREHFEIRARRVGAKGGTAS